MTTAVWVRVEVNGSPVEADVPASESLLEFVRGRAGLTGTKGACGRGECGACTVLVDGRAVMSCVMLAVEAGGRVTTIEGLREDASDLRRSFANAYGFQCGFCTSGQIVRAEALLAERRALDRAEIANAISGNICRCTGYAQIVDAIVEVARTRGVPLRDEEEPR